jgi:hypothetical protein
MQTTLSQGSVFKPPTMTLRLVEFLGHRIQFRGKSEEPTIELPCAFLPILERLGSSSQEYNLRMRRR